MASTSPASRLIAAAARPQLQPLGLRRHGRSRVWLDDHGWWLGLVEFASPQWNQGSGLRVGAMWLWQDTEHFTFNIHQPVSSSESYRTDEQFTPIATELALKAQNEVQALRRLLPHLAAAATYTADQPIRRGQFWDAWNAGVLAALTGQAELAEERFSSALAEDPIAAWMADAQQIALELKSKAHDTEFVRAWAVSRINSCRAKLGLGAATSLDGDLV